MIIIIRITNLGIIDIFIDMKKLEIDVIFKPGKVKTYRFDVSDVTFRYLSVDGGFDDEMWSYIGGYEDEVLDNLFDIQKILLRQILDKKLSIQKDEYKIVDIDLPGSETAIFTIKLI